MSLTVLSVAYPFAPVEPEAVGGAEQILSALDTAMVRAGHRSIVVACEGSRPAGALVAVPRVVGLIDDCAIAAAHARHYRAIVGALRSWPVDLVHMHGLDFQAYLPPPGVPALATLHLPVSWYPARALRPERPDTWLNCVSQSQHAGCGHNPQMLSPIENGVDLDAFSVPHAKRDFALVLARICPEKGIHLALEAAKRADIPLLIGGQVFPYGAHQEYFRRDVVPRLDRWRRFIGIVGPKRKRRLLAAARCLLIPSLVPETSSLVAREALASGTPVVGFARGALVDIIEHGSTGFLVENEIDMAWAITQTGKLDSAACRDAVRARFSAAMMIERYFAAYEVIVRRWRKAPVAGAA